MVSSFVIVYGVNSSHETYLERLLPSIVYFRQVAFSSSPAQKEKGIFPTLRQDAFSAMTNATCGVMALDNKTRKLTCQGKHSG
jgi:hypothetical protein